MSQIVSVTSTLVLSHVVIEAPTEAQKGIISHVPIESLIDVLKSVSGHTLGTLLSRVSREVRIPLLDSAEGHGIVTHIKNCMLSLLPDFFQTLEPPVIDDLLHAFHHDGIRLLVSNAEAEILKAILEECEPGIVADMMRLIPLGELVDMLGQCDHPNVAQIVTDCPANAQDQFVCQLSNDDISSIFSEIRSDSSVMEPQRKKQKIKEVQEGGEKTVKQEGKEKTVKETEIVTNTQLQQIIDLHNNQIQKLQQEIEQTQDIRQQQQKQQQIRLHISQVQRLQRHMQHPPQQ